MNTSEKLRIVIFGVVCAVIYSLSDWEVNGIYSRSALQVALDKYSSAAVKAVVVAHCLLWCFLSSSNYKAYKLYFILIGAFLLAIGRLAFLTYLFTLSRN